MRGLTRKQGIVTPTEALASHSEVTEKWSAALACRREPAVAFRLALRDRPASAAISANFEARHNNMEPALPLNLPLQPVEEVALKLLNLPAPQARHMEMIALGTSLIVVLFALQVHEIQLIHQPMALQQSQRAVHSN